MYKEKRIEAFKLFMGGKTLREIAKELSISRSSIERWSANELWVDERQKVWHEKTKIIKEEVKCELFEASVLASNLFRQGIKEHQAYLNGEIPKKACKFKLNDLLRLSLASLYMGSLDIHKVDRAYKEINELKKLTSKVNKGQ